MQIDGHGYAFTRCTQYPASVALQSAAVDRRAFAGHHAGAGVGGAARSSGAYHMCKKLVCERPRRISSSAADGIPLSAVVADR